MSELMSYTTRGKAKTKMYMESKTKVNQHELAIYFSLKNSPSLNELVRGFCNV